MKTIAGKVFFTAISVLYPVLVFCGIEFWGLSPRRLSILLLALAFYQFLNFTRNRSELGRANSVKTLILVLLILVCGVVSFCADSVLFLKFYPVLVNLSLLAFFGFTLWKKPSFAFRMACLGDKSLKNSPGSRYVERYCDRVTFAWCVFFVANASVAMATVLIASNRVWSLYNGLISYILIGIFFIVEFLIRKIMQNKLHSYIPVCDLELNSRPEGAVVSFDGKNEWTWGKFTQDVSKVRYFLESRDNVPWILHCEDCYLFMVALIAMMQSGRKALVTANRMEAFVKEIRKPGYGFITDEPFGSRSDEATLIQDILKDDESDRPVKFNKFDKSKAEVVLYTSGSTGEPKAIHKYFLQLENELFELVKLFGDEWVNHKIYSTVNHHHIYGLLFMVLVPMAAGLPFRRFRIDYPSELSAIVSEKAVIISSPAFLKRLAADSEKSIGFKYAPMFYSGGGPLPREIAEKDCVLTGSWAIEIYGSTETGGIAYRKSVNGDVWTPFEVCKMSLAENGCLNVKSNYIMEPEGFTTGDLVDLYENGRFLLKGRSDSIVKIEEKRISLTEVEERIKQSGLVHDVRVVPMTGRRQYLAAAIVLNDEGKRKFEGASKLSVNNYFHDYLVKYMENTVTPKKWRYLEELPQNSEGKIRKTDIQDLFNIAESPNFRILSFRKDSDGLTVKLLFPSTSEFYDGHFPEFKLLPAVAQVDVVLKLARNFLNVPKSIALIHRTKFTSPIFPDTPVMLKVFYDEVSSKVNFRFTSADGDKALSMGALTMNSETPNAK